MALPGRYWDSNTFLGWLNGEPSKFDLCDAVIEHAKAGKCRIVTSALTYVEVYWVKRGVKLSAQQQTEILDLFGYSWIVPVELDRMTAEVARMIMWKHPQIKSWDAVHVASAIKARRLGEIECFDTFDGNLSGLSGKLDGTDLRLNLPDLPLAHPLLAGLSLPTVPSTVSEPPSEQSRVVEKAKEPPSEQAPPLVPHAVPKLLPQDSSPTVPPPPQSKK